MLFDILGETNNSNLVQIYDNQLIFSEKINALRYLWSQRSLELEKEQNQIECIEQEKKSILFGDGLEYIIDESILRKLKIMESGINKIVKEKKIAVLRDEGSNGDREMRVAFSTVGFDVYDVTMEDLIQDRYNLDEFVGIAFVGGFSYSDVLGAGSGWKNVIENNEKLKTQFDNFYKRYDTFSIGVCNGCQVMAKLGYIEEKITLNENLSGKFESRFNLVRIERSKSIFLTGMEGMIMGIWSSHGEGRIVGEPENVPMRYVLPGGEPTEMYPFNPNGSKEGI